jgi:hypothetical protein
MSDHLDLIRIKNLEDSQEEAFQGMGATGAEAQHGSASGSFGGSVGTGTVPTSTEIEKSGGTVSPTQAAYDLKQVWAAQQRFTSTLISYLNRLDPGQNGDAGSIITDYINLLSTANSLSSSTTAFDLSTKAALELSIVWDTLNRQQPKEIQKWIESTKAARETIKSSWAAGLDALGVKNAALDALDVANAALRDAQTEEEIQIAQANVATAQVNLTTAENGLAVIDTTGDSLSNLVGTGFDLVTLARALMTGNPALIAASLAEIFLPMAIHWVIEWIQGKVTRKPADPAGDLQKVIEAIQDLALKEGVLKLGDNMELYTKAQALKY